MTDQPAVPPPAAPPPRGPRVRYLLAIVVVGLATLLLGAFYNQKVNSLVSDAKHLLAASQPASAQAPAARAKTWYTCAMHPFIIMDYPGKCPICAMDLEPLDMSTYTGQIALAPVVSQEMGVRVAQVSSGPLTREIRTVGSVDYDETAVRDITTKVSGWIEKLYVNSTGQPVKKGQPLFDLFSPELYIAQTDYLMAIKDSSDPRLAKDVRTRLKFFDISDEQIATLAKSGRPTKTLTIVSPFDGLVVVKNAVEGMKFEPGVNLYRIADLSEVWVMATLYEYQLPYVQVGQNAVMSLPYIPNVNFYGKIAYIYPYLNSELRQVKVRLEFANPGLVLKPGMFANVALDSTLARDRVLVPREAIIDTGTRQVALVSLGQGRFEPRPVELGAETGDGQVEVVSGLKQGEHIVVSAQFLLDSESNRREALAKMVEGRPAGEQKTQAAVEGASELASLPEAASKEIIGLMDDYFVIGRKLSDDTVEGIADPARGLAAHVDAVLNVQIPKAPDFWSRHLEVADLRGKALEMIGVKDIVQGRQVFADLSTAMDSLLKATGVPASYGKEVQRLHCPMFREGQGGTWWLQRAGPIRNPYMPEPAMKTCHDKLFAVPVTGAPPAAAPATGAPTANPSAPATRPAVSPQAQEQIDRLVTAYLRIHKELAAEKPGSVAEPLAAMIQSAGALAADKRLKPLADRIAATAAERLSTIDQTRQMFKGLSQAMIDLVQRAPPSAKVAAAVYRFHCPMVNADWLQADKTTANPYDTSMSTCGSVTETIQAAGQK
jgi:multidrug efflux pump subunit AcrA (membrane-fusion protein)